MEKPWSLSEEAMRYEAARRREPIEPIITTWRDAIVILGEMAVVGTIMAVILVALFLWAGAVVEAP